MTSEGLLRIPNTINSIPHSIFKQPALITSPRNRGEVMSAAV
jgi:hypothetical protein